MSDDQAVEAPWCPAYRHDPARFAAAPARAVVEGTLRGLTVRRCLRDAATLTRVGFLTPTGEHEGWTADQLEQAAADLEPDGALTPRG